MKRVDDRYGGRQIHTSHPAAGNRSQRTGDTQANPPQHGDNRHEIGLGSNAYREETQAIGNDERQGQIFSQSFTSTSSLDDRTLAEQQDDSAIAIETTSGNVENGAGRRLQRTRTPGAVAQTWTAWRARNKTWIFFASSLTTIAILAIVITLKTKAA